MQTMTMNLPPFKPGTKPEPNLRPGTYPAFLQPDRELVDTMYGRSIKLRYLVVWKSGYWKSAEVSELCNAGHSVNPDGSDRYNFPEGSKYTKRVAAVNFLEPKDVDFGTASLSGWVLISLERNDRDERFLKVADVLPMSDGSDLPQLRFGPNDRAALDNSTVPDSAAEYTFAESARAVHLDYRGANPPENSLDERFPEGEEDVPY